MAAHALLTLVSAGGGGNLGSSNSLIRYIDYLKGINRNTKIVKTISKEMGFVFFRIMNRETRRMRMLYLFWVEWGCVKAKVRLIKCDNAILLGVEVVGGHYARLLILTGVTSKLDRANGVRWSEMARISGYSTLRRRRDVVQHWGIFAQK